MQKVVNEVIDIFTSEDIKKYVTGYFLVKHSHLYKLNKYLILSVIFLFE